MPIELSIPANPHEPSAGNGRHPVGLQFGHGDVAEGGLRDAFLISQCLMVVLASLIFAAAEGGPIPAAACARAPCAFYAVDRQRWFNLPNFWTGFLGLVGLLAAFIEYVNGDIEARLLSGGHFMCYLTWIVLWQHKSSRQYWMLAALSILQVSVGSLLTNNYWLGIGLVAYIITSLWTLSVFTMYRMEAVTAESHARRLRALKSTLWFPIDTPPVSRPLMSNSDGAPGISRRFVGISLAVIAASLAFSLVAFLLVPRVWVGQYQIFDNSPLPGSQVLTGFAQEVRLGDLGQVLESSDPVMDVEFYDNLTGRKLSLQEAFELQGTVEPLFRGVVLESYENGAWKSTGSSFSIVSRRTGPRDFLRQEIKLYPIGSHTVFAAGNPNACIAREPVENIHLNPYDRVFARNADANLQTTLRYFALSQVEESVSATPPRAGDPSVTLQVPENLRELAMRTRELVMQTEGLETQRDVAEFLNRWLRDSSEYSYTLSLAISDPNVDPIHDFFFNRKTGHCEYFAATLTMMLRAAGIHARIVSGFKGGTPDAAHGLLRVQQLHAHAWVEAWIDDQWLQLDPTPIARLDVVQQIQSGSVWKRWLNRVQNLWNGGLTWSKNDQDELIYDPVRQGLTVTWETLQSPWTGSHRFWRSLKRFVSDPSRWFSWQGGLAFSVIALFVVGIWKFVRFLVMLVRRRRGLDVAGEDAGNLVPFYARFESLLKKLKLSRDPARTQLEFAAQVRERFNAMPDATSWPTEFPARIANYFYSVRFGGRNMDAAVADSINSELDELEQRIRQREAMNHRPR
jgi:transglutaminase-like putative cysteine protease